jgi:oligosaccharide repeat unit polymerase
MTTASVKQAPSFASRLAPFAVPVALVLSATAPLGLGDFNGRDVLAPVVAGLALSAAFLWVLWVRRYGRVPWFEIGVLYVGVVSVYLAYPLIGFLAIGQHYTPTNDGRLALTQPDASVVAAIGWLYVAHLAGFVAGYLCVRHRVELRRVSLPRPDAPIFIALLVGYLLIEGYVLALGLFYNTTASTYIESYLVARRLPLTLAQLLNHLGGIRYALAVMLMTALFTRYPRTRLVIAAWLIVSGVATVARLGSRTEFVLLVLSAAVIYDTLVRPIPTRLIAGLGAAGLAGFIFFGIVRDRGAEAGPSVQTRNPFAYGSEFENLFGNAVHLSVNRSAIPQLPVAFYFTDFAALVPQQVAPFTKVTPADWYVTTYFPMYAAMGGGLAFGTIAEAVLSGGWLSALLRGLALGCIFAAVYRLHASRPHAFWMFVFYVWLATLCYQSFRNTTFYLVVLCVFRFVPSLVGVNLFAMILRRAGR